MPGTLIQLTPNRDGTAGYRIVYPLAPDPLTGRRRQKWVTMRGATRRQAERELARLISEADKGFETSGGQLTFKQYAEQWLATVSSSVAPSTHQRYGELLNHLVPLLGRKKLSAVTPLDVQHAYESLRSGSFSGKPMGGKTLLNTHRVLFSALRAAMRWGLVTRNVAEFVEAPRPAQYHAPMLLPDDVARVLAVLSDNAYYPIYRTAVATGMRQGEILGLRWSDVDFQHGCVYVQRTARRLRGQGVVFGSTKTTRSSRPVPLSQAVMDILHDQQERQRAARVLYLDVYRDDGLVFSKPDGSPLDGSYVSRVWREAAASVGVKARFHDLRHAFATFALKAGKPVKVVSEVMGHSRTSITENLYQSVLPGLKEDAVEAVEGILAEAMVRSRLEEAE